MLYMYNVQLLALILITETEKYIRCTGYRRIIKTTSIYKLSRI